MPSSKSDPKTSALRQSGCLHPRPGLVRDEAFTSLPFFDPRDLLQAKYEMLRRVRVDGSSVGDSARAFGLSRQTYYNALRAYQSGGLPALLPARPGPRRPHKLTAEVLAALRSERAARPGTGARELARMVADRFGVQLHPRSIERALAHKDEDLPP